MSYGLPSPFNISLNLSCTSSFLYTNESSFSLQSQCNHVRTWQTKHKTTLARGQRLQYKSTRQPPWTSKPFPRPVSFHINLPITISTKMPFLYVKPSGFCGPYKMRAPPIQNPPLKEWKVGGFVATQVPGCGSQFLIPNFWPIELYALERSSPSRIL